MRPPGLALRCLRQQGVGVAINVVADPINACDRLALAQLQGLLSTIIIATVELMLLCPVFPVPGEKVKFESIKPHLARMLEMVVPLRSFLTAIPVSRFPAAASCRSLHLLPTVLLSGGRISTDKKMIAMSGKKHCGKEIFLKSFLFTFVVMRTVPLLQDRPQLLSL